MNYVLNRTPELCEQTRSLDLLSPRASMFLTVILRENQADSMDSQFLGYMEISQSIRKSKVLMSKT